MYTAREDGDQEVGINDCQQKALGLKLEDTKRSIAIIAIKMRISSV